MAATNPNHLASQAPTAQNLGGAHTLGPIHAGRTASPRSRHKISIPAAVALTIAAACDLLRRLTVAGQLGSALLTIAATGLLLTVLPSLFTTQGSRSSRIPAALWFFLGWVGVSNLLLGTSKEGIQNFCIFFLFVAIAALIARESGHYDDFPAIRLLLRIGWTLGFIYAGSIILHGPGTGAWIGARAFALEAVVIMALVVPDRRRSIGSRFLPWFLFALIALSLSRTATAVAALLLIVRVSQTMTGRSLWRGICSVCLLMFGASWAVTHLAVARERVYGGDNSTLLGLRLNTSGRSNFWESLDFGEARQLWTGNGPAASTHKITEIFGPVVTQPHNDYLRLLYDYGIVGLSLWVVGYAFLIRTAMTAVRRSLDASHKAIHVAAVLALTAVGLTMFTDNVIIYGFVMAPVAVIIGTSIALAGKFVTPDSGPKADPVGPRVGCTGQCDTARPGSKVRGTKVSARVKTAMRPGR